MAIWQGIIKFDGNSTFITWSLGIAKRKIADFYRKSYRLPTVAFPENEDVLVSENDFNKIDDNITVNCSLKKLTEKEKEIVFLVFNAELSYAEVCEITGIPIGTIKSKMFSIKAKLKKQFENGGEL